MKNTILIFVLLFVSNLIFSQQTSSLTDIRDGKSYRTVKIGNQWWMAENLAYKPNNGNAWLYFNKAENLNKFGYLYDWNTAQNVCPTGWHLPSEQEFKSLLNHYGTAAYKSLIVNGSSGLNIKNSGYRFEDGGYAFNGVGAAFWTSTRYDEDAWSLTVDASLAKTVYLTISNLGIGSSIRCIKN